MESLMTQVVSVLTVAVVFAGLNIQIARFHGHNWKGVLKGETKTTLGETNIPVQ